MGWAAQSWVLSAQDLKSESQHGQGGKGPPSQTILPPCCGQGHQAPSVLFMLQEQTSQESHDVLPGGQVTCVGVRPSTSQSSSAGGHYAWKLTGKIPSDKHKAANTDPCPLKLQWPGITPCSEAKAMDSVGCAATHCLASSQTCQGQSETKDVLSSSSSGALISLQREAGHSAWKGFPLLPQPFHLAERLLLSRAVSTSGATHHQDIPSESAVTWRAATLGKVRIDTGLTASLPDFSLTIFNSTQQTQSPGNWMLPMGRLAALGERSLQRQKCHITSTTSLSFAKPLRIKTKQNKNNPTQQEFSRNWMQFPFLVWNSHVPTPLQRLGSPNGKIVQTGTTNTECASATY